MTSNDILADRPILMYLSELSEEIQIRLYESRACVLAIFRLLPQIAKRCILYLLFDPRRFVLKI